jgi:gliding motility-associated-like protein
MTNNKLPLICLFLLLWAIPALATHIVGGEITYRCLGNDQYEVKLSVYRDCFNGVPPFDNPAALGVFDANYNLLDSFLLNFTEMDDTLTIYLNNPCLTRPPDVCVHRTTYTTIINLPPIPGGYFLVYQRCCRNMLIQNIPLPEDVGITIITEITEKTMALCNSSAVYNNWPPLAICVHEPVDFDHGAVDPDGDSLVFRLCTPLSGATPDDPLPQPPYPGPYIEVEWQPPYSLSDLLGGQPLTIDPQTGFMTGIPNTIGNFVVGVCVDEYRGGELISTTRRDFQYNVADCGVPVAAYTAPVRQCNNKTVNFVNETELNALGISNWYFDWGGDLSLFSDEYSPTFTYPDTGRYQVALVINPGFSCSDTIVQDIWLTETVAQASFDLSVVECGPNGVTLNLTDMSVDAQYGIQQVTWNIFGPNTTIVSNENTLKVNLSQAGNYSVTLEALGGNGCSDEFTIPFNIPFPPNQNLSAEYSICAGDSIDIFANAALNLAYQWAPDPDISDPEKGSQVVSPTTSATYTVTITDPASGCNWIRTASVTVLSSGGVSALANPPSILLGDNSQLLATSPGQVNYAWSPTATLSSPNTAFTIATPSVTTDYMVTITTSSGCTQTTSVRVVVLDPRCEEPFLFFPTGFSPNDDGENDQLKLESRFVDEVYWVIYNRWGQKMYEATRLDDAWDGTFKGEAQPAETYGYYYRVRCLNGVVTERKGNVTLLR